MSPEICFNLDQCKVLLSDNGLKEIGRWIVGLSMKIAREIVDMHVGQISATLPFLPKTVFIMPRNESLGYIFFLCPSVCNLQTYYFSVTS